MSYIFPKKQLSEIDCIIFDLGGVIVDIDYQRPIKEFSKLGFNNINEIYSQCYQIELFDKFDKGLISPQEFREKLLINYSISITPKEFNNAWNSIIIGIKEETLNCIVKLKSKFKTLILSNTNLIHVDFMDKYLKHTYNIENINYLVHNVHYSCKMGMRKPDKEIFETVLNTNNLVPHRTLFIDDTIVNIESAKSLGFITYLMRKDDSIKELFSEIL